MIAVFVPLIVFATSSLAHAQTLDAVGARAEGMGSAFVAIADDATAIYWNPAGIATGANFDLHVGVTRGSTVFIGASLPMLGAGFYRLEREVGLPTVSPSPDRENEGSGKVPIRTLTTTNIGATVVQTIVPGLVIGSTLRLVRGGFEGVEGQTRLDIDAGAMVSAWDLRFGLVARNLSRPEFSHGDGVVGMDRQIRIGAALAPRSLPMGVHGPYSVAIDADLTATKDPRGDRRLVAAGGEYWLAQGRVGARAGVRWSTLGDSYRAFSTGLTVKLPRSVFAEGHVTKPNDDAAAQWSVGARVTF